MVFSHPVSFSESSSTFAEDNQQENTAASSFIEYSGHFPDFLPEGASDISSIIYTDIEPSIINSVGNSEEDDIKESPFSQSKAHKIKISDTNTYGVNEDENYEINCLTIARIGKISNFIVPLLQIQNSLS